MRTLIPNLRIVLFLLAGVGGHSALHGQIPQTDLYMFQLAQDDTGRWHVHTPLFLSGFNSGGYTNQPAFITDSLLFVSVRMPDSTQNDIYSLDVTTRRLTRVTQTPANEFSPMLCPDGKTFSCVRQVEGDDIDQRVYIYPLDKSGNGYPAFSDLDHVGYYCWLTRKNLALYLVDSLPRLALADVRADTYQYHATNIGRCLRTISGNDLVYVHKYTDAYWYLKSMDLQSRRSEIIVEMPADVEDFAIAPDGTFFTGDGSVLKVLNRSGKTKWETVFDLSIFGVREITRMAINDRLQIAIVSKRE